MPVERQRTPNRDLAQDFISLCQELPGLEVWFNKFKIVSITRTVAAKEITSIVIKGDNGHGGWLRYKVKYT